MDKQTLTGKRAWLVQTDGDEEGRSVRNLGTFFGTLVEVSKALGEKQFYNLHLTDKGSEDTGCDPLPIPKKIPKEIHICFLHENKIQLAKDLAREYPSENIQVSNYYQSIKIVS
jgi:hypothetical protein